MTHEIQECLEAIKFCNQFCMFSLYDLRDISNASKDQFKVTKQSFNVRDAIKEVLNMYKMQANLKNIQIYSNVSLTMPLTLITDKTRMQQIISNLLSNAIKFSEADTEVILKYEHYPREELLQIKVYDHGIGISYDDAAKIFKPFVTL